MGTQIFLGKPPASIEAWIKDKAKTDILFQDGTNEKYMIEGELSIDKLIELQIFDERDGWIKNPIYVDIGSAVTSIGSLAFQGSNLIKLLMGKSKVTSIGTRAFAGAYLDSAPEFPSTLQSIGEMAFFGQSNLPKIVLPSSVMSIGESAFEGCYSLAEVWFEGDKPADVSNYAFYEMHAGCIGYVKPGTDWTGVEIPGEWKRLQLQYAPQA